MRRRWTPAAILWLACAGCSPGPDSRLPPAYRSARVPAARLGTAEARENGRRLYLQYCALCHGKRADGRGARRQGLATSPRDFSDPAWRKGASPRAVYHAVREGVRGTPMPSWKSLSEAEAWDLVAYVLSVGEPPA